MLKKMKISEINRKGPVTYITTKLPDGKTELNIVCWWTPSTKALLKALKNGDTLVTDPISRIIPQEV